MAEPTNGSELVWIDLEPTANDPDYRFVSEQGSRRQPRLLGGRTSRRRGTSAVLGASAVAVLALIGGLSLVPDDVRSRAAVSAPASSPATAVGPGPVDGGLATATPGAGLDRNVASSRLVPRSCDEATSAPTRCFWFTVPERRDVIDSRTVRLWVAVVDPKPPRTRTVPDGPSATPTDSKRAVSITAVGPEGVAPSTGWAASAADAAPANTTVIVDQRGTGRSTPRLDCVPRTEPATATEWSARAWRGRAETTRCRDRLLAVGFALDGYDIVDRAQDLAELRVALGISAWDVVGTSTGSRLALELVRQDRAGVRSLVLDSPVGDEATPEFIAAAEHSIDELDERCAADPACDAFGSFRANLDGALARLDATPVRVDLADGSSVVVDGDVLLEGIRVLMELSDDVTTLPIAVRATVDGDGELIHGIATTLAGRGAGAKGAGRVAEQLLRCADWAASSAGGTAAEPTDTGRWSLLAASLPESVCADWSAAAPTTPDLVGSADIAVLVIVGELDPNPVDREAARIASTFPHTALVEVPDGGHVVGQTSGCVKTIVAAFQADPARPPSLDCLD